MVDGGFILITVGPLSLAIVFAIVSRRLQVPSRGRWTAVVGAVLLVVAAVAAAVLRSFLHERGVGGLSWVVVIALAGVAIATAREPCYDECVEVDAMTVERIVRTKPTAYVTWYVVDAGVGHRAIRSDERIPPDDAAELFEQLSPVTIDEWLDTDRSLDTTGS